MIKKIMLLFGHTHANFSEKKTLRNLFLGKTKKRFLEKYLNGMKKRFEIRFMIKI